MGSGCTSGSGLTNNILRPIPDTTVKYTGAPIPDLGICTGDTLLEVEVVIINKILDFAKGVGITILDIDLTKCDCFKAHITCCGPASCQTLICILEAYLDCLCDLYSDVQTLKTEVGAMYDGPYDVKCLDANSGGTVTNSSKLPAITQELIKEFCALYTQVQLIQTTLNTFLSTGLNIAIGNFLNSAITSCNTDAVVKSGTGASFTLALKGQNPIGTITMFSTTAGGKLSWFDSNGLGYSGQPACGWHLCNGLDNVMDFRGYAPVGVNDGTMGAGSQDPRVDNGIHPGQAYMFNSIGGNISNSIVPTNVPSMTVSGTTSAVTASLSFYTVSRVHATTGDNTMGYMCDGSGTSTPCPSAPNFTIPVSVPAVPFSATIGSGSPTPFDVRQPYRAVYFMQRVS